jgi:hypothetical protein
MLFSSHFYEEKEKEKKQKERKGGVGSIIEDLYPFVIDKPSLNPKSNKMNKTQ